MLTLICLVVETDFSPKLLEISPFFLLLVSGLKKKKKSGVDTANVGSFFH